MAVVAELHWNRSQPAPRPIWPGPEAFIGVAAAAVLGLTLGAAVKPTADEITQGPTPMEPTTRTETSVDLAPDNAYAAYHGRLPDYVIGTDWAHPKLPTLDVTPPALPQPIEMAEASPTAPLPASPARYEEPPPPELPYPSQGGDMLARPPAEPVPD